MATTDARPSRSDSHSRTRSQTIPSRPTTPLRPPSRTSLRASQTTPTYHPHGPGRPGPGSPSSPSNNAYHDSHVDPLATLEPAFAELSDNMADLEANFMHLQLLNESLGRFTENFAAFLYGMNMTAFCVDFPEAPMPASFARHAKDTRASTSQLLQNSPFRTSHTPAAHLADTDATFLTTDTSFVENPPASSVKPTPSAAASASAARRTIGGAGSGRGGIPSSTTRGGAASGARVRGGAAASSTSSSTSRGHARSTSGIARGTTRGTSSSARGGRIR